MYISQVGGVVAVAATLTARVSAVPYNTFDGEGFPACHDVSAVHDVTSVEEMVSLVKDAAANGTPVRASGKAHMWYDTMCSDDPRTVIIRTENANAISEFELAEGAASGSVVIEAGVTFLQLAEYLHGRGASMVGDFADLVFVSHG
jgi:L-gulonolactone oxidase